MTSKGRKIIATIPKKNDLMNMPKKTENNTNPCLYSFLSGLKNDTRRSLTENRENAYELIYLKSLNKLNKTSLYQNSSR